MALNEILKSKIDSCYESKDYYFVHVNEGYDFEDDLYQINKKDKSVKTIPYLGFLVDYKKNSERLAVDDFIKRFKNV